MTAAANLTLLVDAIDGVLPQTQCTKCGHTGCRPYAEAIACGSADINQCPPGGTAGIDALARLLERPARPLNPANGVETPRTVAVIDERLCIGCTLCIVACPVDCIIGAPKKMHTVIASQCTGCDLCVTPCPMDCIAMVPVASPGEWTRADADAARRRHAQRNARRARERAPSDERLGANAAAANTHADTRGDPLDAERARRRAVVDAAVARARARRALLANPRR
jgi:electron transport complex protein RnfB